jgi:hypothetical protein
VSTVVLEDLTAWPAVTLEEIERDAALQTRVDRKYVVTRAELADVLASVEGALRVLDIAGERAFSYRSTYFDTPDLASYRAAASGRGERFKVRTRSYLTTGTSWLEVKLRGRSGQTSKHRMEHDAELDLDPSTWSFLDEFELVRPHIAAMRPSITTTYERTTLLCARPGAAAGDVAEQRVTIDVDVWCRQPDGTPIAGLGHHLVVETKSHDARPGPLDKALWRCGARPMPISKYAVGVASARPDLTANRWHRVLRRYVQLVDTPDPIPGDPP